MKLKRDQLTGAVLVILGIVVFLMTTTFSIPITASYPGPRMLPTIAAFGFVVCGLGIFAESAMSKKEEKQFLAKEGWIRVIVTLIVIAAYITAMTVAGYLIATPIILYVLTTMFAKGSQTTVKARVIFSAAVSVIIFGIYVYAFGLTLPGGMLFG
ncbi:MAG: tripartite tricarboxylate transporter TctB family protein [Lachnospiraceae bacterium]|jgi:putative tricarboxylic transport membrane protein|nr:tripartite tricarboxylate transporter TctB family protein [Lachnospiraceae bacterium]